MNIGLYITITKLGHVHKNINLKSRWWRREAVGSGLEGAGGN